MRRGIAVSPGVAVGKAYCIHEVFVNPETKRLVEREVNAELASYERACDRTAADLRALQTKVEIRRRGAGGAVHLRFYSEEELQRLYELLLEAARR